MTQAKHTPGPWFIEHLDWAQKGHVCISAKDHGELAQVVWLMEDDELMGRNSPEKEANARLIAAAPDLLEALQLSLSVMERDWHQIDNEWGPIIGVFGDLEGAVTAVKAEGIAEARAAITKATGATQ